MTMRTDPPAAAPGRRPREMPAPLLALRHIHLLDGLADPELAEIAQAVRWHHWRRGRTIVRHSDAGRDLILIASGRVRVTLLSPGGRELRLRELGAGELFGEIAAIDGGPRSASVVALEDSVLGHLAPQDFLQLLQRHWPVCEALLLRLAGAVRELTGRCYELGALSVPQRLAAELLRRAEAGGPRLDPAPHHPDLAACIGSSREQVSRTLARLVRSGLLRRDGTALCLSDPRRLHRLAQGLAEGLTGGLAGGADDTN